LILLVQIVVVLALGLALGALALAYRRPLLETGLAVAVGAAVVIVAVAAVAFFFGPIVTAAFGMLSNHAGDLGWTVGAMVAVGLAATVAGVALRAWARQRARTPRQRDDPH
jgi:hypothetical protein